MNREKVSIVKVADKTVDAAVKLAVDLIGGMEKFLKPGQSVVLKPNYTGNLPQDSGGVTSNAVMESVIRLLQDAGAGKIVILEGCGTIALGTKRICENLGIDKIAERYGVELRDANLAEMCTETHETFVELEQVTYTREIKDFDLVINVPVMKTHPLTDVTVAMKNMNGLLEPKEKRHFHDMNLRQAIVDFHQILPKYLTIVDGITAMEGMGPAEGTPVPLGIIMAGANPVAVDATGARIMDFDPKQVVYLQYAEQAGLGPVEEDQIEICGEPICNVKRHFQPAEPGKLSFDGVTIIEEKSALNCVGCRAVVAIALSRIRAAGQLKEFKGMHILLHDAPSKDIELGEGEQLLCIGNCTRDYCEACNDPNVHFVMGCAPAGLTVEEAMRRIYGVAKKNQEMTAAGPIGGK